MYQINLSTNSIEPLKKETFSNLNLRERNHLQEWIAKRPDVLGEELLIIQKEFNKFDDTNERLDLLALDKQGNLVIIENKLDDSGKDVVWQGLKYTGYCSNFTTEQIYNIYDEYLLEQRVTPEQSAQDIIAEFIGTDEAADEEIVLNKTQRIFFVAAAFRKEVTNTVLWLMQHKISCKCIKVSPFSKGKELFLTVEQVLPIPESEAFMIGLQEKKVEEQQYEQGKARRQQIRQGFWAYVLPKLEENHIEYFKGRAPLKYNAITTSFCLPDMFLQLAFGKKFVRVDFKINTNDKAFNETFFNLVCDHKDKIEAKFGGELDWDIMPDTKYSKVAIEHPLEEDGFMSESWGSMAEWFVDTLPRFAKALEKPVKQVNSKLLMGHKGAA